jgi:hypothetical protein
LTTWLPNLICVLKPIAKRPPRSLFGFAHGQATLSALNRPLRDALRRSLDSKICLPGLVGLALGFRASRIESLHPIAGRMRRECKLPEVLLELNTAQAIAMILHEPATNSVKSGSLSVPKRKLT